MTNREYIENFSDKEFVIFMGLADTCDCCLLDGGDCFWNNYDRAICFENKLKWLQAEHKEGNNDK